jgi:hypothetical protein
LELHDEDPCVFGSRTIRVNEVNSELQDVTSEEPQLTITFLQETSYIYISNHMTSTHGPLSDTILGWRGLEKVGMTLFRFTSAWLHASSTVVDI